MNVTKISRPLVLVGSLALGLCAYAHDVPSATTCEPPTQGEGSEPKSPYGDKILAYGLSELGVEQDGTALIEKALRSVGKKVGDLAPDQFFQYGVTVANPKAGDLVFYSNAGLGLPHIAIYIDENQAVHGGWNGFTTAIGPLRVGTGPVSYIRVL